MAVGGSASLNLWEGVQSTLKIYKPPFLILVPVRFRSSTSNINWNTVLDINYVYCEEAF